MKRLLLFLVLAPLAVAQLDPRTAATKFYAGPTSGGDAVPAFRSMVPGDVPTLNQSTSGNAATATALAATPNKCAAGNYPLGVDASGNAQNCTAAGGGGGSGTVTSVDMSVPVEFILTGNPITTSGTFALTKATQTANKIYAGPTSGGAVVPTFRAMVAGDVPTLNQSTTGNAATATALAATPTKCSAGNYPLGVDASGNAQNCTAAGGGGNGNSVFGVKFYDQLAAGATLYCEVLPGRTANGACFASGGVEWSRSSIMPMAGTGSHLYCQMADAGQPAGNPLVVTIDKSTNGSGVQPTFTSSALTVSFAGSGGAYAQVSDVTHTLTWAAGDRLAFRVNNQNASASGFVLDCSFQAAW